MPPRRTRGAEARPSPALMSLLKLLAKDGGSTDASESHRGLVKGYATLEAVARVALCSPATCDLAPEKAEIALEYRTDELDLLEQMRAMGLGLPVPTPRMNRVIRVYAPLDANGRAAVKVKAEFYDARGANAIETAVRNRNWAHRPVNGVTDQRRAGGPRPASAATITKDGFLLRVTTVILQHHTEPEPNSSGDDDTTKLGELAAKRERNRALRDGLSPTDLARMYESDHPGSKFYDDLKTIYDSPTANKNALRLRVLAKDLQEDNEVHVQPPKKWVKEQVHTARFRRGSRPIGSAAAAADAA